MKKKIVKFFFIRFKSYIILDNIYRIDIIDKVESMVIIVQLSLYKV